MLMRPVKFPVLITIILLSSIPAFSQVRLLPGTSLRNDIETIIKDYPNHFRHIIGDELVKNPQSIDYKSTVIPDGSEDCMITKYSSAKKEVYSWKATMFTTDDFD